MTVLDGRLLRVGIEVGGVFRTYTDLAITVTGTKFASPTQGECNVTIANLSQEVSDFILTETSPFNPDRSAKRIVVEAGRRSTGYSLLYSGIIFRSSISQPPDALLSIRALTGQFQKGNVIARNGTATAPLSRIALQVANDLGLPLQFSATDVQVANYSFTGAAIKQVNRLAQMAPVDAYVDNDVLIVKNTADPLQGRVRRLSADTGMIGVPTFTEQGARVTLLYDSTTVLGGALEIVSEQYPALTGRYLIYKLNYNITNRDTPFYYIAECRRLTGGR